VLGHAAVGVELAGEIIGGQGDADALHGGAIKFEGEMLDPPMFGKALQTLLRAHALRAITPEDKNFALQVLELLPAQVIRQNWPYGAIL
jgi:hypothetical protein